MLHIPSKQIPVIELEDINKVLGKLDYPFLNICYKDSYYPISIGIQQINELKNDFKEDEWAIFCCPQISNKELQEYRRLNTIPLKNLIDLYEHLYYKENMRGIVLIHI